MTDVFLLLHITEPFCVGVMPGHESSLPLPLGRNISLEYPPTQSYKRWPNPPRPECSVRDSTNIDKLLHAATCPLEIPNIHNIQIILTPWGQALEFYLKRLKPTQAQAMTVSHTSKQTNGRCL